MDDLNFDRELRAVLDAAPSRDFLARTRIKLAEQSLQRRPVRWWMPLAAGVAIAAVAVVVNLAPSRTTSEPRAELAVLTSRPFESRVAPLPNVASYLPETEIIVRSSAPKVTADADLPFVLVAEADKRAFEQLVAALQRQPFEASFDQIPASEQWLNTALAVAPINITPLEPSAAQNN